MSHPRMGVQSRAKDLFNSFKVFLCDEQELQGSSSQGLLHYQYSYRPFETCKQAPTESIRTSTGRSA